MDSRRAGESFILLGSLLFATLRIACEPSDGAYNHWISYELYTLLAAALLYMMYTYCTLSDRATPIPDKPPPLQNTHPQSSQAKRKLVDDKFGFIWMSVPKNYRNSSDDGILTGLLLGPFISAALLWTALAPSEGDGIPAGWAIEPPFRLPARNVRALPPHEALIRARYNLVSLSILTSFILLLHVCASRWLEDRCRRVTVSIPPARSSSPCPSGVNGSATSSSGSLLSPAQINGNSSSSGNGPATATANGNIGASEGERRSVPRSEGWRTVYFVLFTLGVSTAAFLLRLALRHHGSGFWQHLSLFDVLVAALFYQFTLYVALRMAHRSLTLGELGLVCFGGTAVFMEFLNITISKIWPITTPYLKTYRLPTPLVVFQSALIGGPFLAGFLVAPFLVLSRHAAQTPIRRQRRQSPADALRTRKILAASAAGGVLLIVFGPLGLWTRWCLGNRDPWVWALRWVLGRRRRIALLGYWGALGSVSVAGWARQLARSRRAAGMGAAVGVGLGSGMGGMGMSMSMGGMMGKGPIAAAGNGTNDTPTTPTSALFAVSGELLDRAPTLGLNARRKFFHGLVVVMFIPGIAFDPAFTHLAFSVAFALFVFAEYIRYFAIYPLGVAVHLFMSEFLDTKDESSTAILSHFYLLTGCAGALWLEGPSRLLGFTGLLVLGIGDALASIVGKQHGRHAWSPTTSKTLEGSAAFSVSVLASVWVLRLCGLVETFSTLLYALVIALAAVLEALSGQNDNLTLPLYTWSALTLVGVS
ncbi:Dolichol kinase [Mycena sanguinolenta]|uniref:dolichol kinase n=1 Tax=Mycena sanguinolenta TaxID=230812 RepID=A0A8H7DI43_9AGAR|nr:Dolichol kinase [Mycena sanguinolenta]